MKYLPYSSDKRKRTRASLGSIRASRWVLHWVFKPFALKSLKRLEQVWRSYSRLTFSFHSPLHSRLAKPLGSLHVTACEKDRVFSDVSAGSVANSNFIKQSKLKHLSHASQRSSSAVSLQLYGHSLSSLSSVSVKRPSWSGLLRPNRPVFSFPAWLWRAERASLVFACTLSSADGWFMLNDSYKIPIALGLCAWLWAVYIWL